MTIYDSLFPLGIGTNRFAISGSEDYTGIEKSAQMVVTALEAGVSYVDVAHTYSRGMAQAVCKLAFSQTNAPRHVTVKSSFLSDQTEDDALRRVESTFLNLGIDHAFSFVVWNIASYEQFAALTQRGALYDGAVLAKERGMVDHICFSTHAPPEDIIKMLDSGLFEGVTLSFSVLNSSIMKPVLYRAQERNIGVAVMNPLGGGLIPQQEDYYNFLCGKGECSAIQGALRYVYAHPAVKIVLSGISSMTELNENIAAFQEKTLERPAERIKRVDSALYRIDGFCTGCRYCDGCPKGIRIFELMQAYNTTFFPRPKKLYGRTDPELLEDIEICARLKNTFGYLPDDTVSPCINCGMCEMKCTAHLPITQRIKGLYRRFERRNFSKRSMLDRLKRLVSGRTKIAFYPGGGYTLFVLSLLREVNPEQKFEIFLSDSNPKLWGTYAAGIEIQPLEQVMLRDPEIIIISNYNFEEEICQSLLSRVKDIIPVVKLHVPDDVPWVF